VTPGYALTQFNLFDVNMATTRRKSSVIATGSWKTPKAPLISRTSSNLTGYPRASRSFIGSIHDARRATGLLENEHNFAETTNVQVYESTLTQGLNQVTLDETSSFEWLEVRLVRTICSTVNLLISN
jgi:hypothetical protein